VRPTQEAVRAAWLTELEPELPGAHVLDLFSGTGALGLEALSRGAASVDFVENGAPALHALKANVAKLRVKSRSRLFKKDVFLFLEGVPRFEKPEGSGRLGGEAAGHPEGEAAEGPARKTAGHPTRDTYDLALADPPYTSRAARRLVTLWLKSPFSRILCVEHTVQDQLPGAGKRRRFEDTVVTTYRIRP
jgi:16S rRNA (guanine966-N2)-methyltransferase